MRIGGLALAVGLWASSAAALAQEGPQGPPNFIALGAGVTPEYIGSDDYMVIPFAAFEYDAGFAQLSLRGLSVSADLLPSLRDSPFGFQAGPVLSYRFGRDEDIDNQVVRLLPEIDNAIEGGVFVGYRGPGFGSRDAYELRADFNADLSDAYGGYTIGLDAAYSQALTPRLRANYTVGLSYGSEEFFDTYFGVSQDGSLSSGLPTFEADAGFYQATAAIGLNYDLSDRWGVYGQVAASRLIGDAADSPIVDREGSATQLRGGLGIAYKF